MCSVFCGLRNIRSHAEGYVTGRGEVGKLFAVSADDITQITYNWQEEEIALEKDGNDWQYKEDAAFSLNQTMAETMSEALSGAEVLQKIEEKDVDLQSFGLETPALAVTFSDGDGQQYQLSFGNYNTAAKGYYAMKMMMAVYTWWTVKP